MHITSDFCVASVEAEFNIEEFPKDSLHSFSNCAKLRANQALARHYKTKEQQEQGVVEGECGTHWYLFSRTAGDRPRQH